MADVPPFSACATFGVGWQGFDNNGQILAGGKIYSYQAGSNTPKDTFTSREGTQANANPIILNAGGRIPSGQMWLNTDEPYKLVLEDSLGNLIGTYDDVTATRGIQGIQGLRGDEGEQGQTGGEGGAGHDPFVGFFRAYCPTAPLNLAASSTVWTVIPLVLGNFIEGSAFNGKVTMNADGKGVQIASAATNATTLIDAAIDIQLTSSYTSTAFKARLRNGPLPFNPAAQTNIAVPIEGYGCIEGVAQYSSGPSNPDYFFASPTAVTPHILYLEVMAPDAPAGLQITGIGLRVMGLAMDPAAPGAPD